MADVKHQILIVEDDLDVADMLNAYFRVQGYDVRIANWGEDAVRTSLENPPDLIVLDIRLPDIDGYEVASRLRGDRRTKEVPIIFLTDRRGRSDRLHGLELGADDYVTKPFDVQELRLRVRNALRRLSQGTLTNPITNLPEGVLVEERMKECLSSDGWALLLIDVRHLDDFRDAYGFVASDDVLRALSLMIHNAIREVGSPNDFVGQYGTSQFIIFSTPSVLPDVRERIGSRLDQSLEYFYPLKDRGRTDLGNRLDITMKQLIHTEGPFASFEQLREKLLI